MFKFAEDLVNKQNRQIFNMPLNRAVILFSALLYVIIALSCSIVYYFSMQKTLGESTAHELKQIINTRQVMLNAQLDREILLMRIFADASPVEAYFANPNDENFKRIYFAMLDEYKELFQNKMIGWVNTSDLKYHVNDEFKEKYDPANPKHFWFFETLKYERNTAFIKVDFDYLDRQDYDLYIDFPVYSKDKAIGAICSRYSLSGFIKALDLPKNVFVFSKDGVVIGSADERIAEEKKNIKDLFGSRSEEVYKRILNMEENTNSMFNIGEMQYLAGNSIKPDYFIVAEYKVDLKRIMQERASKVFAILLLILFLVVVIFNKFISRILKPIKKNMQSYVKSSLIDELTRLPNRRFFNMRMENEWDRAIRAKYPLSFLMLDLDKFKDYNDKYGHATGDVLLRETARIFGNYASRHLDFAARIGGEEFCVILANTKAEEAKKIAESIRAAVEKAGKATVSIGVACKIPEQGDDYKELMESADQKLYEAKNTGRNKVCG